MTKGFKLAGRVNGFEKASALQLRLLESRVSLRDYVVQHSDREYSFFVKPQYLCFVKTLIDGINSIAEV